MEFDPVEIERQVDALFEREDAITFSILSQIVEIVQTEKGALSQGTPSILISERGTFLE
jgi:hypothetical protein